MPNVDRGVASYWTFFTPARITSLSETMSGEAGAGGDDPCAVVPEVDTFLAAQPAWVLGGTLAEAAPRGLLRASEAEATHAATPDVMSDRKEHRSRSLVPRRAGGRLAQLMEDPDRRSEPPCRNRSEIKLFLNRPVCVDPAGAPGRQCYRQSRAASWR